MTKHVYINFRKFPPISHTKVLIKKNIIGNKIDPFYVINLMAGVCKECIFFMICFPVVRRKNINLHDEQNYTLDVLMQACIMYGWCFLMYLFHIFHFFGVRSLSSPLASLTVHTCIIDLYIFMPQLKYTPIFYYPWLHFLSSLFFLLSSPISSSQDFFDIWET